jgi:hypothetical protein
MAFQSIHITELQKVYELCTYVMLSIVHAHTVRLEDNPTQNFTVAKFIFNLEQTIQSVFICYNGSKLINCLVIWTNLIVI